MQHAAECGTITSMHRITIFHYHLQTGGITQVIADSVYSVLQQSPDQFEIKIVSGRQEQTDEFIARLNDRVPSPVEAEVFSLIDYTDMMDDPPDTSRIRREMLRRYGGTIWWIHNYHIGKNPQFTRAVVDIALQHPEQQIVLHIHDFPESGRFLNLKKIQSQMDDILYPVCPNVRYVVINSRDYHILTNAGIPESHVFLLNNPVNAEGNNGFIDIWSVHDKINRWAMDRLPFWHEHGKLILYPIRAIRRKNVLEAALLTNLLDTPANLLVTLPGRSNQEKQYSDLVEQAFEEKLVPGAWALGTHLEEFETSFNELTHSADLIVSSSIQEGFGYLFINSILWSVPLVARGLDILDGIKPLFTPDSSHFYREITVSLSTTERTVLQAVFRQGIDDLTGLLPAGIIANLTDEVEQILAADTIDYAFLTPELQYTLLERITGSEEYRSELIELNAEVVAVTGNLLRGSKPADKRKALREFGPAAHTDQILFILNSFAHPETENTIKTGDSPHPGSGSIEAEVLKAFGHPGYFRPLFHM